MNILSSGVKVQDHWGAQRTNVEDTRSQMGVWSDGEMLTVVVAQPMRRVHAAAMVARWGQLNRQRIDNFKRSLWNLCSDIAALRMIYERDRSWFVKRRF